MRKSVLVALPVLGLAALFAARTRWPVDAEAAPVQRGAVVDEVLGVGVLEGDEEVRAAFTAPGRLRTVTVDEGDAVHAGDRLATLDLDDAAREVEVAAAQEREADAALRRAAAELDRARSAAADATRARERATALHTDAVISDASFDEAVAREAQALADLRAREAAYGQAEAAVRVADRNTAARTARADDAVLASPFDGIVLRRHADPGQVLGAGSPVLTLASTSPLRVRAWVDETALARLAEGRAARVRLRSDPDTDLAGRVTRVGRQVDRQTHELLVDVELLGAPARFAIGQRADVWIAAETRADVVRVPRGWCDEAGGRCLVDRAGVAVEVPVTLGLRGPAHAEVVDGLAPGDTVLRPREPGATIAGRRVRAGGAS